MPRPEYANPHIAYLQFGSNTSNKNHTTTAMAKKSNRNKRKSRKSKSRTSGAAADGPSFSILQPLTDRNLQTLLEQNSPGRYGPVALDMDRYAREQQHLRGLYAAPDDHLSVYSNRSHDLLLAFGQLNPSLHHLSDATSLDDVCFPDYYEESPNAHTWPDLGVLEEFITDELAELEPDDTPRDVNFDYPVARHVSGMRRDDSILPTNEEAPLLLLVAVDELLLHRLGELLLRVRPRAIQPWEKRPLPAAKDVQCRFTYFRDDQERTVHLPTLLGLIMSDEGVDEPNEAHAKADVSARLRALFAPELATRASTPEVENGSTPASRLQQRLGLPLTALAAGTAPPTAANSVSMSRTPPFWLDVLDPLEEEMKVLSKTFGLHPLTTEDIFLGETREKVELFRQYYFICFTSFDIVYERRKQRAKEHEKKLSKILDYLRLDDTLGWLPWLRRESTRPHVSAGLSVSKGRNTRGGELCPLNMYMIVFKNGVLTFHFSATPHPINVRRRARMLKDHLHVSTDWICYALIDDITDSFAPMIDSIEQEVYLIEDEIMKMHSGDTDSDLGDDSDSDIDDFERPKRSDVFYRRQRSKSIVETPPPLTSTFWGAGKRGSREFNALGSRRSTTTATSSKSTRIVAWKRKGDMLRRIGECRKRVMSVMRLLGSKADVIKGFSKRFNESETLAKDELPQLSTRLALRGEILMYLGDIQDHIVTMVQSLNHYEKLLARSHSNYLAQINIDMTKVNNDTNDVLGKITILGTIVLPINVVTGLWGMNCIVPGQDHEGLVWFYGILVGITIFSLGSYVYARRVTGL